MNEESLFAIVRELRKMAESLPDGKRRDVNNKLDRVQYAIRKDAHTVTVTSIVEDESERFSSQAKTIYNYLLEGHTITSEEARIIFGAARLASRICDIEKQTGITPSRRRIQVRNRFGKDVYVNEYWIDKENLL